MKKALLERQAELSIYSLSILPAFSFPVLIENRWKKEYGEKTNDEWEAHEKEDAVHGIV